MYRSAVPTAFAGNGRLSHRAVDAPAAEAKFEAIEVAKHARHDGCLPSPFEQVSLPQRLVHGAVNAEEMLRRLAVQARRLHLRASEARSYAQGPLQNETQCLYSTQVPREYQGYYLHKPLQPKPRAVQPAAPEATAAAATEAAPGTSGTFQENVSTNSARAGESNVSCASFLIGNVAKSCHVPSLC